MVSVRHGFLPEVDRVAEEELRSRGELIGDALRHYIDARHRRGQGQLTVRPGDPPQVQDAVASLKALAQGEAHSGEGNNQEQRRKEAHSQGRRPSFQCGGRGSGRTGG